MGANLMKQLVAALHKITYFSSWIASFALFFMAGITTVDVFARYLFNKPILGSDELVELAMVVFVYGAMARATVARTHVCANVLHPLLSKRRREILGAFAFTVAGVAFALMAWRTCIEAGAAMASLTSRISLTLRLPIGPFYIFIAFGLILLCVELVFDVLRRISDAKAAPVGKPEAKKAEGEETRAGGG